MTHILPARGRVPRFDPRHLSGNRNRYQGDKGASGSLWSDVSGQGNNLTQPAAGNRPTFSPTALNGFPGLTFSGSHYMLLPTIVAGAKTALFAWQMSSLPGVGVLRTLMRGVDTAGNRTEIVFVSQVSLYQNLTFFFDFPTSGGTSVGIPLPFDTNAHTGIIGYSGGNRSDVGSYTAAIDGNPYVVVASNSINATANSVGSIGARANAAGIEGFPFPGTIVRGDIYAGFQTNVDTTIYQRAVGNGNIHLLHDWLSRGFTSTPTWTDQVIPHGNSITQGQGVTTAQAWPALLRDDYGAANKAVWNFGSNGQTTLQMINRFDSDVRPMFNPRRTGFTGNIYICWEITNDIGNGATGVTAAARVEECCRKARAAGASKIIVANCIDRGDFSPTQLQYLSDANAIVLANSPTYADRHIDMHAIFPDHNDATKYLDGTHPTALGHTLIKAQMKTAIDT